MALLQDVKTETPTRTLTCQTSLVIYVLLILPALAQGQPTYFVSQPSTAPYHVKEGEAGPVLNCVVHDKFSPENGYHLQWYHADASGGSYVLISIDSENRQSSRYELDRESCSGCYNLRIRKVSFKHDNGRFVCQVQPKNGAPVDSQPANVVVLVRPQRPLIANEPPTPLVEHRSASATCRSIGGNPPPHIEWKFTNGTAILNANVRNGTSLDSPTESTVHWIVSPGDNEQQLICSVRNPAMEREEQPLTAATSRFSVHYLPRVSVTPSGSTSQVVERGATVTLHCAADANPPVTEHTWSFQSASNPTLVDSYRSDVWTFAVARDRGGNYTCTARNSVGLASASTAVTVVYAPIVSTPKDITVREAERLQIVCNVDASPEATTVEWIGPSASSENNNLVIEKASRSDAGNYTCSASNYLKDGQRNRRYGYSSTNVIVEFAPGQAVASQVGGPAVVGASATLQCESAEPGYPAAEYYWRIPGQLAFESTPRSILKIDRVQLTDAGDYLCQARNALGVGTPGSVRLIVYQPATLEKFPVVETEKLEGDAGFMFACTARGHPAPNITWFKDGVPISKRQGAHWRTGQQQHGEGSASGCTHTDLCSYQVTGTLAWQDGIKWNDKGTYTCQAFNGAGVPEERNMILRVVHKPVIVNNPNRPMVAADIGETVTIECKASARPAPSFRWYFAANDISSDYKLYDFTPGHSGNNDSFYDIYTNKLFIREVRDAEDQGKYRCVATNSEGSGAFTFAVQPRSAPGTAGDLTIAERAHNWMQLAWAPGFDGGYHQQFEIELRTKDSQRRIRAFNTSGMAAVSNSPLLFDQPSYLTQNITDLRPSTAYRLRVRAFNRLGSPGYSDDLLATSRPAPTDRNILKPINVTFHQADETIEFKETVDSQIFCLQVYVRKTQSAEWQPWDCVRTTSPANIEGASAKEVQVRYCYLRGSLACSPYVLAQQGRPAGVSLSTLIPACVAAIVFAVLAVVLCLWCRRCRPGASLKQQKAAAMRRGLVMSSDSDDSRKNAPRGNGYISAPYHPTQAGSKDSGLFTSSHQSVNFNYQADMPWEQHQNGAFMTDSGGDFGDGALRAALEQHQYRASYTAEQQPPVDWRSFSENPAMQYTHNVMNDNVSLRSNNSDFYAMQYPHNTSTSRSKRVLQEVIV